MSTQQNQHPQQHTQQHFLTPGAGGGGGGARDSPYNYQPAVVATATAAAAATTTPPHASIFNQPPMNTPAVSEHYQHHHNNNNHHHNNHHHHPSFMSTPGRTNTTTNNYYQNNSYNYNTHLPGIVTPPTTPTQHSNSILLNQIQLTSPDPPRMTTTPTPAIQWRSLPSSFCSFFPSSSSRPFPQQRQQLFYPYISKEHQLSLWGKDVLSSSSSFEDGLIDFFRLRHLPTTTAIELSMNHNNDNNHNNNHNNNNNNYPIPTDEDMIQTLHSVSMHYQSIITTSPTNTTTNHHYYQTFSQWIHDCHWTIPEIKVILSYIDNGGNNPVYRWFQIWLSSRNRYENENGNENDGISIFLQDDLIQDLIVPFFLILHSAIEKIPSHYY